MGTAPPLRYSRWKIKSERQEFPGRIPRHPAYNVEHPGEVRRAEKINQSVAAGPRASHSSTLQGGARGVLALVCIGALILFSIYCLGFRVCDFWARRKVTAAHCPGFGGLGKFQVRQAHLRA